MASINFTQGTVVPVEWFNDTDAIVYDVFGGASTKSAALASLSTPLASIDSLSTSADQMIYTTASDTYATTPLTSFSRTLLDDADAATARGTLGAAGTGDANVFTKTQYQSKAASVASAATVTLPTDGNFVHITGTTTITDFTHITGDGPFFLVFDAALTLTHTAGQLELPGGANITTAVGDTCILWQDGTTWRVTNYETVDGTPLKIAADSITATEIATGAVGTSELAADSVTANEIAANAVNSSEIATNAVTGSKINKSPTQSSVTLTTSYWYPPDGVYLFFLPDDNGTIQAYINGLWQTIKSGGGASSSPYWDKFIFVYGSNVRLTAASSFTMYYWSF